MRVRLYNNDGSDFADYEGDTIEDIIEAAKDRMSRESWRNGHSEVLER